MTLTDTLQPVLEKKFPAALVAAFLLQSAGAIYWAGSAANRIAVLEQTAQHNQTTIDRVAEQMLMPRSWVVTQILREWAERRSSEIHELEQSWNGSYREELGRHGLEAPLNDAQPQQA